MSNQKQVGEFLNELADLLEKHHVDFSSRHKSKFCFHFNDLSNGVWGPPLYVQIPETSNDKGHWMGGKTIRKHLMELPDGYLFTGEAAADRMRKMITKCVSDEGEKT